MRNLAAIHPTHSSGIFSFFHLQSAELTAHRVFFSLVSRIQGDGLFIIPSAASA